MTGQYSIYNGEQFNPLSREDILRIEATRLAVDSLTGSANEVFIKHRAASIFKYLDTGQI